MKTLVSITLVLLVSLICQGCTSAMVYNNSKAKYRIKQSYESLRLSIKDDSLQPIISYDDEMIGYCYSGDDEYIKENLSTGLVIDSATPWKVIMMQPFKQSVALVWDALCAWGAQQIINELTNKEE